MSRKFREDWDLWRTLAVLLASVTMTLAAMAQVVELDDQGLRIGFDGKTGGLATLTDSSTGQVLCEPRAPYGTLWQLEIEGRKALTFEDASGFQIERLKGNRPSIALTWSEFGPDLPGLRVRATVSMEEGTQLSRWHLRVSGLAGKKLLKTTFPILRDVHPQTNEALAVPIWMGQVNYNPRALVAGNARQGGRLQWDYPGMLSLQCLALYGENRSGLYLACNDTAAFRKVFAVSGEPSRALHLEVVHLPENITGSAEWNMPYHVLVGALHGDWMTAAEAYRGWATNQVWAKQSRLARRLVPAWVLDTGVWVWNRGRSEAVLDPALELQKRLDQPVSVFWHWWHGCSYDAGFPEYFPPREGTAPFKKAMAKAHQKDVRALVYMNQRLWGMTTPSWGEEGAATYAVKDAQGKVRPEIYNTFTQSPCAAMCMGTSFWREKYAGLAERAIRELRVDGIYMDQACTSLACYDTQHSHPSGGGTYWIEGFKKMQQDIRDHSKGHPALAGEGCGEPWLPYLDIMLSLQVSKERYAGPDGWDPIPFFHAVYHAYSVSYGNYSSLTMPPYDDLWPQETAPKTALQLLDRKFSGQFYLEQARAFVWGQQPTIANFIPSLFEQRAEEVNYVLHLAKLRAQAKPYLQDGTFLRPPPLMVPGTNLNMSRLSIYAGQGETLREFQKELPTVLAGAWRSPSGNVAIALASISDQPIDLDLKLAKEIYDIPKNTPICRIDRRGRTQLGKFTGDSVKVSLSAHSGCVLEFQ